MERRSLIQNRAAELVGHVATALDRVRGLLGREGLDAVVLTTPANVAWLTGGLGARVDRTAGSDPVWLVVSDDRFTGITSGVEYPRLRERLEGIGVDAIARVPWAPPSAYLEAAVAALPPGRRRFGIDAGCGGSAAGEPVMVESELVPLRMALTGYGQSALAALGLDGARAVEAAVRAWSPGETDREVQGRACLELERRGIEPAVVIVGGDERVRSVRHPVAVGKPVAELLMVVVVGVRDGLNVALTRFATARPEAGLFAEGMAELGRIQEEVVAAAVLGRSYGHLAETLAGAYARSGHPEEWRNHFQGGPIAYQQREFEIAPGEVTSRWYDLEVEKGHAVAYNPSLPGGPKVEDTYLIGVDGARCVTDTGDWPRLPLPGGTLVAGTLALV